MRTPHRPPAGRFGPAAILLSLLALAPSAASAPQVPGVGPDPAFRPPRFGDAPELAYDEELPGASHDPGLPDPERVLGQALGSRLSHHGEILACFRSWAERSPRLRVATYARSHEGRELLLAVIGSPANLAPRGVFLRGRVDEDAWITAGCGPQMPVFLDGDSAFLARPPARTAVRLAGPERLRHSGLLWPEARERPAHSAYLTVEPLGPGQVVLFASAPGYRGVVRSTGRLLANAVVYGPGVGASAPIGW